MAVKKKKRKTSNGCLTPLFRLSQLNFIQKEISRGLHTMLEEPNVQQINGMEEKPFFSGVSCKLW